MFAKTALARSLQLAAFALVAVAGAASASPPSDGSGGPPPEGAHPGGRHRPPPFAYEACAGASVDATCSVELPDNTVEGKCVADENDELFCRPNHMPEPPRR